MAVVATAPTFLRPSDQFDVICPGPLHRRLLPVQYQEAVSYGAERPKRFDRAHTEMLDDADRHAVVAHAHHRRPCVLQLHHVFPVFVYLSLVYLANLVLIALVEPLAYGNSTDADSRVSVVKRVQRYSESLARLSPQPPRQSIRPPRALLVRPDVFAEAAAEYLHSQILTERLQVRQVQHQQLPQLWR